MVRWEGTESVSSQDHRVKQDSVAALELCAQVVSGAHIHSVVSGAGV